MSEAAGPDAAEFAVADLVENEQFLPVHFETVQAGELTRVGVTERG